MRMVLAIAALLPTLVHNAVAQAPPRTSVPVATPPSTSSTSTVATGAESQPGRLVVLVPLRVQELSALAELCRKGREQNFAEADTAFCRSLAELE